MSLVLFISVIIFMISVIFALQNSSIIIVKFLVWQFNIQIALLILGAFFLGFLTNLMITIPQRMKKNKSIAENNRKIRKLEEDLAKYRNLLIGSRNK